MQILKWILAQNEMKIYSNYLKGLNQIFKSLKEILTQEMTKMPLGAKLTKKMIQLIFFEMNFDMRLKQGFIQTNLKDSNNFQG